jgi:hypothetical protein
MSSVSALVCMSAMLLMVYAGTGKRMLVRRKPRRDDRRWRRK